MKGINGRKRGRENGIKNTFFRDYSPPLLTPQPFRPPERTDGGGGALKGQTDKRREEMEENVTTDGHTSL